MSEWRHFGTARGVASTRNHQQAVPEGPSGHHRIATAVQSSRYLGTASNQILNRYFGTDLDVASRGTESWLQFF